MYVGEYLRQLREQAGLTQQQLAEKLDVTQPSISRLERRHDILLSTFGACLRALGHEQVTIPTISKPPG